MMILAGLVQDNNMASALRSLRSIKGGVCANGSSALLFALEFRLLNAN